MDESQKRGQVGEAIFVILFFFAIIIFLVYKYAYNGDTVTNNNLPKESVTATTAIDVVSTLDSDQQNQTFNKYAKQIYEAQKSGANTNIDQIVSDYQDEVQVKTKIPTQIVTLKNVSNTYDKASYRADFENLFADLKSKGATGESQIFAAQIVDKNTLIPLSDDDKETLLRAATDYEIFAKKLMTLNTPIAYQTFAKNIAQESLNISYILKQMINEPDNKIYTVWISKYMENMSVIITSRYALQK